MTQTNPITALFHSVGGTARLKPDKSLVALDLCGKREPRVILRLHMARGRTRRTNILIVHHVALAPELRSRGHFSDFLYNELAYTPNISALVVQDVINPRLARTLSHSPLWKRMPSLSGDPCFCMRIVAGSTRLGARRLPGQRKTNKEP